MQKHLLHGDQGSMQEAHSGWGHMAWVVVLLVLLAVLGPCSRTAGTDHTAERPPELIALGL